MSRSHLRLWTLAALIAACGGENEIPDASSPAVDAAESPPDAFETTCETCSVVAQTGCDTQERCGIIWESVAPPDGRVRCLPVGSRALGESCSINWDIGVDDCQKGLLCWEFTADDPRCVQICTTLNGGNCTAGTCVELVDVFECFDLHGGVCME